MRLIIFGDIGEGKTLTMTALGLYYKSKGYNLFSNYHLKKVKYEFIESTNFAKALNFDDKSCVLLDELGVTTSTRNIHAISFSNILAQSRKAIGEKSHMIMTAQTQHQTNNLIKGLVDYIAYPKLYRDLNDIPYFCVLSMYQKLNNVGIFIPSQKKIIKHLQEVMKYYDTSELVDTFKDGTLIELKEKYGEYVNSIGKKKELRTKLIYSEGKGKSESTDLAEAIIADL